MYSIITSLGFVIDSRPYGEAGKIFSILTSDLGLVRAAAQGIRLEKSKLRYHIELYTLGQFSFVKGKDIWRLTSANRIEVPDEKKLDELLAKLALVLKRLLQGEASHPELYGLIEEVVQNFDFSLLNDQDWSMLETLTVIRILHALGYINERDIPKSAYVDKNSLELVRSLVQYRKSLNQEINRALRESQL